jgi:hypothetical protein
MAASETRPGATPPAGPLVTAGGPRRLVLYLLDGERGQTLQYWSFDAKDEVRIGRAGDNDVVIPHPCVSRAHARLTLARRGCRVVAVSQQGLIVGAERLMEAELGAGGEFRLGAGGPYLRIGHGESDEDGDTADVGGGRQIFLVIDPDRLGKEVSRIADGEYFQRLRQSVASLREARRGDGGGGGAGGGAAPSSGSDASTGVDAR